MHFNRGPGRQIVDRAGYDGRDGDDRDCMAHKSELHESMLDESQWFTSRFLSSLRTVNDVTETNSANRIQVNAPMVAKRYINEIGSSNAKVRNHATVTISQFVDYRMNMNKLIK